MQPVQIRLGILLASEQAVADVSDVLFLGELSLDGSLRHLQGVLPMAGLVRDRGIETVSGSDSVAGESVRCGALERVLTARDRGLVCRSAGLTRGPMRTPPHASGRLDL